MNQTFTAPVNQVAAGDINNFGPVTWEQFPTEKLHLYRKHYRSLLWAARRRLLFNLPNLLFAIATLGGASYVYYLLTQLGAGQLINTVNQIPAWAFFGYPIFCIGLPMYFVLKTRRREAAIIQNCRDHFQAIDIALNARGES